MRVTGGKALPQEIAEYIIDRTDGVPLFIEELTKAVIESGMLTDVGDRFDARAPLPRFAIPTSLQASLLHGSIAWHPCARWRRSSGPRAVILA